jgi:hypothetical protein
VNVYADWKDYLYRSPMDTKLEGRVKVQREFHVRHLERLPLRMAYTEQVDHIISLITRVEKNIVVCADGTGVGRPILDLLWRGLPPRLKGTKQKVTPCPITITGGSTLTRNPWGGWNVPKRDLVHGPPVLMQDGRLKVASGLELRDVFQKELLNFKVKINISTPHDSYEAWREGIHDDLVLAVSMPCWAAEKFKKPRKFVSLGAYVDMSAPVLVD